MDEIGRLQAEFMQLQRQQSANSISERVSVEILLKLKERGLVEVFYTSDRKDFLTPQQLEREIHDEVILHRGRLDIHELLPLFNLDESVVESTARKLVEKERTLSLIGSSLVACEYLERVAEEINESLVIEEIGRAHV